jgi:hypothetical protein
VGTEATLLDALRAVPGVATADLEPDDRPEGAGTLRLQLAPGADEIAVATSVNRVLREQFGLAVDAGRVQVVEESVPFAPPAPPVQPLGDPYADVPAAPAPVADVSPLEPVPPAPPGRPTLTAVPGYVEPEADAGEPVTTVPPAEATPPTQTPGTATTETTETTVSDVGTGETITPRLIESTRPPRILIQRMQLVSAGLGVTTSVSLTWQGHAYVGECSAAATPTSVHRSVATATLRALEEVVGTAARFELEQLEINQLGPDRAVVVVVSMLTKLGSERLTGVSVVREDVRQAVIRATLDALNRRLESLLLPA